MAETRKHLKAASAVLRRTVGGAQSQSVVTGLQIATAQTALAHADLKKGAYAGARVKLDVAIDAESSALSAFGMPVAKDFQAFTVYRNLSGIQGFEEFLGLTAKVGAPIAKVVIGIAGRETANAGESGRKPAAPSLPITKLALYTLQEPSGAFSSGWCDLVNGIMICDLDPTMKADESFAVAFGPPVPKGTKFLVKFWSTDGRRSHAILTTR